MRRPATCAILGLALALGLSGCAGSSAPRLKVSGAYVPQPPLADMAAGYLTVTNTGDAAAELTSVTSDLAAAITLHSVDGNRMRDVTSFTVPARGKLTLARGGNHLMLAELQHKPTVGDKVSMELHFDGAGPIGVQVPVEPTTYRPKD